MDASQERPAGSGTPRLSRLPLPKSGIPRPTFSSSVSSAPRPPSSAEASGGRELHSPKLRSTASRGHSTPLRPAASRDQLRSSVSRPPAQRPSGNRVVSTPQRRTSLFTNRTPSRATDVSINSLDNSAEDWIASRQPSASSLPQETSGSPVDDIGSTSGPAGDGKNELLPLRTPNTKPRPSLSERTIETLANIPSSPALSKKHSSFFDQGRPRSRAGSGSSRPGSSYNSDGSGRPQSRSSSRSASRGEYDPSTATFKSALSTIDGTPEKTTESRFTKTPQSHKPPRTSLASASKLPPFLPDGRSASPDKRPAAKTPLRQTSKNAAGKSLKTKASANGLFKKPSLPAMNRNAPGGDQSADVASWNGAIPPLNTPSKKPSTSKQDAPALTNRKSSLALREQIAKARAAKKAAEKSAPKVQSSQRDELSPIVPTDDGFDFGIDDHPDPFGQRRHEAPGAKVLQQRISAARTTGRLNIAALDLKEMPTEVVKMYDMESMGSAGGSWAESVDLTRLIAADNEFEALGNELFPDVLHDEYSVDDDAPTAIFGGLETMDLHGNKLSAVPMGFRRLNHLTSLNLSNNRLDNSCLQIVAQMTALRDLKMANNKLEGPLNASISLLDSLEILDLHGNKLTDLPNDFDSLSRLRILNLGENAFASVSFTMLSKLPLTELTLKKNKLSNTLIDSETEAMAMIQTLDISCNQIKSLVLPGSVISFPVLHTLSASMNRLQELPDMTTWTSLLTLTLDENNISSIPEGFMTLTKLRQVDFSGNDIRVVPPELARMDNLSMIRLAGNPLRDKKFATATTDELKEILAGRLEPPPPYEEHGGQTITCLMNKLVDMDSQGASPAADDDYRSDGDDKFATPPTSVPHSPARSRSHTVDSIQTQFYMPEVENWVVKAGGVLDRSETQISTLPEDKCRKVAAGKPVKQAQLHRNLFTAIPSSLAIFSQSLSSLSLSYNQLAGNSYMSEPLELPALKELNLASNRISDLRPMMDMLQAPALEKLDVSLNRLTSLPGNLLEMFPKLSVLVATNNQLTELNPDTIRGLKILEVANNDIAQLDPRLGLLGGRGGLQRLEVSGNRFKVPRWNILDRGTHATLRWLRGRVPEEEMNKWRAENGDDASDMD